MSDGGYCSCLLASIIKKTGKPIYLFLFIFSSFTPGKTSATNFLLCVCMCRESLVGGALKTGEEREMNGKGGVG
jgi:hypothetical protein